MGTYWHRGCLGVSHGFLKHLNEQEQYAVLAYQLCQISRFDSVGFGMASLLANALVSFASLADELWPFKFKFFSRIFAPFSWLVIRLSVHSRKYLENDLHACKLISNKRDLASAIYKMENFALAAPKILPACTGHLFVVNPDRSQPNNWFLNFQPNLVVRIKNILGTYPL
jgi:heat shock protein HtpX